MTNDTLLHPTDADLLAHLDGEISVIDASRIARHVERCHECRHTINLFRTTSSGVADLLAGVSMARTESPRIPSSRAVGAPRLAIVRQHDPPRWYSRPSLRAAMIMVGLGAATLAVTPVRGWVVEFFRAMTGSGSATDIGSPTLQAPSVPPIPSLTSTSSVSFVPPAGEFTIHLANEQAEGTLRIIAVGGNQATGRITDRGSDDALLVTSSGFRVQNGGSSKASYMFGLPSSISEFVVQIGDRVALRGSWGQLTNDGPIAINLVRHSP